MNDAFKPVNDKSLGDINAANHDMWDAGKPNVQAAIKASPGAHSHTALERQIAKAANVPRSVARKELRKASTRHDGEMDLPSKEIGKRAGKRAAKIGGQDAKKPSMAALRAYFGAVQKHESQEFSKGKHIPFKKSSQKLLRPKKQKDESDPELSTPSTEVGAKDAKKIHGPLSAMQTIAAKNEELHSSLRPGRKPGESTIRQKVMSRPRSETPGWMGKSEREASAHLRRQKDATMEQIQHRARIKRIVKTHDPGGTHTAKFDRCVEEVKGSGKNAYAICMSSIGKNEALK